MKVTLEFNLPKETEECRITYNATKFHAALWDLDDACRSWLKHGHAFKSIKEALEAIREQIPPEVWE